MKTTNVFLSIFLIISTSFGLTYLGDGKLCITDSLNNETCIENNETYTLNNGSSYVFTLYDADLSKKSTTDIIMSAAYVLFSAFIAGSIILTFIWIAKSMD